MHPLTLLEKQLDVWNHALEHSNQAYKERLITQEVHETHVKNLTNKIRLYEHAIKILNTDPLCQRR